MTERALRSLLKWAGGKRALVKRIVELFPEDYMDRSYHEPFFGGGAVFFHIEPRGGTINDVNPRLMNFYRVVRDMPRELIEEALKYRYEEGSNTSSGAGTTAACAIVFSIVLRLNFLKLFYERIHSCGYIIQIVLYHKIYINKRVYHSDFAWI